MMFVLGLLTGILLSIIALMVLCMCTVAKTTVPPQRVDTQA